MTEQPKVEGPAPMTDEERQTVEGFSASEESLTAAICKAIVVGVLLGLACTWLGPKAWEYIRPWLHQITT